MKQYNPFLAMEKRGVMSNINELYSIHFPFYRVSRKREMIMIVMDLYDYKTDTYFINSDSFVHQRTDVMNNSVVSEEITKKELIERIQQVKRMDEGNPKQLFTYKCDEVIEYLRTRC